MPSKFCGTIDELKKIVISAGIQGKWQSDGSKQTFRSFAGGILNWWPSGTIQFQGKSDEKLYLERLVKRALSEKPKKMGLEVAQECPVPDIPRRSQSNPLKATCCESEALLKRIKKALSKFGITIVLINDSVNIVRTDTEYDYYNSLIKYGSEIHIRKL